ncbi:MAG: rhodanese-like domain-containing protein [Bdellovibrionales bacterium]
MNMRTVSILGGILLLLVVGKMVMTATQKNAPKRADPATLVTRPNARPDPVNPRTPKDATEVLKVKELQQSEACDRNKKSPSVLGVPWNSYQRLARGLVAYQLSIEDNDCLVRNKIYPAEVFRRTKNNKTVFYREKIAGLRVVEIKLVPYRILGDTLKDMPPPQIARVVNRFKQTLRRNQDEQAALSRAQMRDKLFQSQVLVVKLRMEDRNLARPTYGAPLEHPAAKNITSDELRANLSRYRIVDVRPNTHYRLGSLPQAIPLEPGNYEVLNEDIQSPEALLKKGASFDLERLPKDKSTQLVVFSNGPGDLASYNAISLIATLDYSKIFWLRGGYDEWNKIIFSTEIPSTATAIDAPQALTLMRQNAIFLDVRPPLRFSQSSVRGSENLQMRTQLDERGFQKYLPPTYTSAGLATNKESLIKPRPYNKQNALVLYGRNEYDIRAHKAAVLLVQLGYRKVYVLKGGFHEWMHYNSLMPNDYPVFTGRQPGRRKKGGP